jgi:hypothetical protein
MTGKEYAPEAMPIERIAIAALAPGLLGVAAILAAMRLITRALWARYHMVVAERQPPSELRENGREGGPAHSAGRATRGAVVSVIFGIAI